MNSRSLLYVLGCIALVLVIVILVVNYISVK